MTRKFWNDIMPRCTGYVKGDIVLEFKDGRVLNRIHILKIVNIVCVILGCLSIVCYSIAMLCLTYNEYFAGNTAYSVIVLAFALCSVGAFVIWFKAGIKSTFAKYVFTQQGVMVKFPWEPERKISWDEFQDVCICYYGYSTSGIKCAYVVIALVMHGEEKDGYGRWETSNVLKYRSVFKLDFTMELYNEIVKQCPYPIPDRRYEPEWEL